MPHSVWLNSWWFTNDEAELTTFTRAGVDGDRILHSFSWWISLSCGHGEMADKKVASSASDSEASVFWDTFVDWLLWKRKVDR